MPALTRLREMKLLEPMPKSAAPPASSCGTFTSGPALEDLHLQPALGIQPFGQRLVEAAMLGLRLPVGDKADGGGGGGGPRQRGKVAEARLETERCGGSMAALYMIWLAQREARIQRPERGGGGGVPDPHRRRRTASPAGRRDGAARRCVLRLFRRQVRAAGSASHRQCRPRPRRRRSISSSSGGGCTERSSGFSGKPCSAASMASRQI